MKYCTRFFILLFLFCNFALAQVHIAIDDSMVNHRIFPSATKLLDGRVLITGGYTKSNGVVTTTKTAEIFDPATNSFTQVGDMARERKQHGSITLNNGKVLVVGGTSSNNYPNDVNLTSCELFDPNTNSFTNTGSLQNGRYLLMLGMMDDGRVMVVGGGQDHPSSGDLALTSCEIYDPNTGLFTPGTSLNTARMRTKMVKLQDSRFVIAGGVRGSGGVGAGSAYNTIEVYDPVTGQWTYNGSNLNTARMPFGGVSVLNDGRVFVTGGHASTYSGSAIYSTTEIITVDGGVSYGINLTHQRTTHEQVTLNDGRVYLAGSSADTGTPLDNAALIDINNNTISNIPMHDFRNGHQIVLLNDERVLLIGGTYNLDAEIFDPNGSTSSSGNGIVGCWPFNGNANDESGNGNGGNVYGATLTEDRFGNLNSAYSFDGINDYIEVPHVQSLNLNSQFTISLFFKTDDSDGRYLAAKGNEGSNPHWDITTQAAPKTSIMYGYHTPTVLS